MVILGAVKANFWIGFAAATTLIFGAAYTLWMYKRVIFGAVANDRRGRAEGHQRPRIPGPRAAGRVRARHGPVPAPFTEVMHASVNDLLKHVAASKL